MTDTRSYQEDDLLPISALAQLLYCERRCALIHIEGAWRDNVPTTEGTQLHQRVHQQQGEARGDIRIARSVALRSLRLGLVGKADVVEFHPVPAHGTGAPLPGLPGHWRPFPIEYKRGRPKPDRTDEVQLCAQALCLEEMLDTAVPAGALFYGATRRRHDVPLDPALRQLTQRTARRLHQLLSDTTTPPATPGPKCRQCSLRPLCLPKATRRSAQRYLGRILDPDDAHPDGGQ